MPDHAAHARARANRGIRMKPWRERLDARIRRCIGCDQWAWDGVCAGCAEGDRVMVDRYPEDARTGPGMCANTPEALDTSSPRRA